MIRRRIIVSLILGLLAWPSGWALANDGLDRYEGHGPTMLMLFPDPVGGSDGYTVLERDMEGGADGDPAFRWARPEAIALVRLAAHKSQPRKSKGPGQTMAIFDLSAENGDTPIGFEQGKPPRGRHPGGSHDGGINLDLGYYLNSTKGRYYTPDFSACSDHFVEAERGSPAGPAPRDAHACRGPADRLNVSRQVAFLLELFRLNREYFGGEWIEQVGVDLKIREKILAHLKKTGADRALVRDIKRALISDRWEGWSGSHHHHIHLRLSPLSPLGAYRHSFATLMDKELALDRKLLLKASKGKPVLRARLISVGLNRAVELTVLGLKGAIQGVTFDTDQTEAVVADPFHRPRWRATIDLPPGFATGTAQLKCSAQVQLSNKRVLTLQSLLSLPRKEAHLAIGVRPERVRGSYEPDGRGGAWLKLDIPRSYKPLVTAVSWEAFKADGQPEIVVPTTLHSAVYLSQVAGLKLVRAKVVLSGRKAIFVPAHSARP